MKSVPNYTKWQESLTKMFFGIFTFTTIQEENLTSRQDEGLTERRHHRNLTLQEDDITKRQPCKKDRKKDLWKMASACLASQSFTELGPTQPQLV